MKHKSLITAVSAWVFFLMLTVQTGIAQTVSVQKPSDYFGFVPGADRMLMDYEQLIGYLQKLDAASPRLKMVEIGKSPMGKPMYIAFFSSETNINNLDRLKEINRELALNPDLSKEKQQKLVREGKVFFIATLSMHSSEVGPSQAAPLIAYELVTTQNPEVLGWMDNVVYMMVPCHNPDGMDFIVENYRKYKGTKYEGASLPRVYHKYVGHDNNRDFVILSQEDTKNIQHIFTQTWFPQVMVEKHQMGSTGPRYFVPPNSDPTAENIDAAMWTWTGIFGQNMINDMTQAGLAGVSQHYAFDNYWPGSTETCIWQNVIAFLTECASAHYATPIYVEPSELAVRGKGLSEYKKSINMPLPWKGGWWRLGDIVQYEITSTRSILKTASLYHDKILKFRNDLCRKNVNLGKTTPPYYYIMPVMPGQQHDESELVNLVNLLGEQGVSVYKMNKDYVLDGQVYHAGDLVVPLAQPFRAFIKEVMEKQHFPVRHYTPGGKIIKPYDITTWSLPLERQITCMEIDKRDKTLEADLSPVKQPFTLLVQPLKGTTAEIFPVSYNESFKAAFLAAGQGLTVERLKKKVTLEGHTLAAGSFVISGDNEKGWDLLDREIKFQPIAVPDKSSLSVEPFHAPRIALIETYYSDMDAGWTRYIFDTYHIHYTVIHPDKIPSTDLNNYDVIVFPSSSKEVLLNGSSGSGSGYYMASYAPEYSKGMGKDGLKKLMSFVDKGGVIVSWEGSTGLFEGNLSINHKKGKKDVVTEKFRLPFRNISKNLQEKGLYVPGSLIRVSLLKDSPLTYGLPHSIGVFSRGWPVFATSVPYFDMDRRVIGWYPEENILMSGYAEHPELLANQPAVVWLKKGKGQLVLMGFCPQFRASTQASYKLLFNALLLPPLK